MVFQHMVIICVLVIKAHESIPEMFALLVILVLHASVALRPALLKPGALTGHLGRVYLVEDALWVTYPHEPLVEIPERLQEVASRLNATLWHLEKELPDGAKEPNEILFLLHARVRFVTEMIDSAIENYEGLSVTNRTKRGLINGIGKISQFLFGTAMNEDVEDLKGKYNQLLSIAKSNHKAINLNCRNIERLEKQVTDLASYANLLGQSMNVMLAKLNSAYEYSVIGHALSALESVVTSLLDTNHRITRNIVDAAMGRVTTSLFPEKDFKRILEIGSTVYSLSPLFDESMIHHYYPLVESVLTSEAIVIHVPFKSQDIFELYRLEPFPFAVNNVVMILDAESSLVLVKDDFSVYATNKFSTLSECRSEYRNLYFCPASLFAFLPVKGGGSCEVVLTKKDASAALSLCPYKQLVPKVMFHNSFQGHHYFYFTEPLYVSVACPNGSAYQEVSGHFAVLTVCSLKSESFHVFPEKFHEGFISNITSPIFPINTLTKLNLTKIKFVTNTVSEFSFTNISDFETGIQESLPVYLDPYVHFPTLFVPILVFCLILIPLCCCLKRATSLYEVLKARLQRPPEDTGITPL